MCEIILEFSVVSVLSYFVGMFYFYISGKGIGSLVTGFLFRYIGDRWTFRVFAIACVPVLVVYMIYNVRSKEKKANIDST